MNDFLKLIVSSENSKESLAVIINLTSSNIYAYIYDMIYEIRSEFQVSTSECFVDILKEGRFTNNQIVSCFVPQNKTSPDWPLIDYADFQMLYGNF